MTRSDWYQAPNSRVEMRTKVKSALALIAVLIAQLISSGARAEEPTPRIAVAYDIGFKGDGGFNDAVSAALEIAKKRYNLVEPFVRELPTSGTALDRLTKLRFLAKSGYTLIIAVGSGYRETVRRVSMEYTDTQFALINDQTLAQLNISNIYFDEIQAARVAGTIASLRSKSKVVAIISGGDALNAAFESRAKGVKVLKLNYEGDSNKLLMELGSADIVYSLWDRDSKVFEAVTSRTPRTWYIARNPDQYFAKMGASKRILAVLEKRLEKPISLLVRLGLENRALIDIVDDARGVFGKTYNFENGGYRVTLAPGFTAKQLTQIKARYPKIDLA